MNDLSGLPNIERTDAAQQGFSAAVAAEQASREARLPAVLVDAPTYARAMNRAYRDGWEAAKAQADVPAAEPFFYNGNTAYDKGYERGLSDGIKKQRDATHDEFDKGMEWGYSRGDGERQALATANSELRSIIKAARDLARTQAPYFELLTVLRGGSL